MKRMILAAAVSAAAIGSAYAKGDGGCVKKPGRPKAVAELRPPDCSRVRCIPPDSLAGGQT